MGNLHLDSSEWLKSLTKIFWETTQPLDAILIIDNTGNILEHRVSVQIKKSHDAEWLKYIARKISVRFKVVDFTKELGGLAMTINVFQGKLMLVKSLNPDYTLILIIPLENDLKKTITSLSDFVTK